MHVAPLEPCYNQKTTLLKNKPPYPNVEALCFVLLWTYIIVNHSYVLLVVPTLIFEFSALRGLFPVWAPCFIF